MANVGRTSWSNFSLGTALTATIFWATCCQGMSSGSFTIIPWHSEDPGFHQWHLCWMFLRWKKITWKIFIWKLRELLPVWGEKSHRLTNTLIQYVEALYVPHQFVCLHSCFRSLNMKSTSKYIICEGDLSLISQQNYPLS